MKTALKLIIIIITAVICGLCFNFISGQKLDFVRKPSYAVFTTLNKSKTLFDKSSATFVDARKEEEYAYERIAGAVNIPYANYNKDTVNKISRSKAVIVYCSGFDCKDAATVADKLVKSGFAKVFILQEGLPGWKEKGFPTEK